MAVNRLPWHKVQTSLLEHPKYKALSMADRGVLHGLWCIAAGHSRRGSLPSPAICASRLGGYYAGHTERMRDKLEFLCSAGWLEVQSDGSYLIHDWDIWQGKPDVSTQRVRAFRARSRLPNPSPNSTTNSTTEQEKQVVTNEPVAENVTGFCNVEERREKKKHKNYGVLSLFPDLDGLSENSVGKTNGGDPRTIPLKAFITSEWLEWRGCSITSASTARDWDQFAAMLRRSRGDPAYSLSGLQSSFSRFAAARDRFTRSQGLGYWSLNAFRWFPDSVGGVGVQRSKSEGQASGNAAGLLSSDWWRDA